MEFCREASMLGSSNTGHPSYETFSPPVQWHDNDIHVRIVRCSVVCRWKCKLVSLEHGGGGGANSSGWLPALKGEKGENTTLHSAMLTDTFQSNAFQYKCISVEISRPSREVIQLIVVQCVFPDSKARQGEDKQRLAGGWSPSIVSCQRKPEKLLLSREGRGSHWQIAFLSFHFVFQSQWLNHVCQQNHGFICLKNQNACSWTATLSRRGGNLIWAAATAPDWEEIIHCFKLFLLSFVFCGCIAFIWINTLNVDLIAPSSLQSRSAMLTQVNIFPLHEKLPHLLPTEQMTKDCAQFHHIVDFPSVCSRPLFAICFVSSPHVTPLEARLCPGIGAGLQIDAIALLLLSSTGFQPDISFHPRQHLHIFTTTSIR